MKYKLVFGIMSVFCAIVVTIVQMFATKISKIILWQVYIPLKLVEPSSPIHPGANGEIIIEWNPEVQLIVCCVGIIFGIVLYSYIIFKMLNKKRPPRRESEEFQNPDGLELKSASRKYNLQQAMVIYSWVLITFIVERMSFSSVPIIIGSIDQTKAN